MYDKPFVIGITGNIASGKSVVRNYLANTGAYTIDADLTAQDTYLPGLPAWQEILDEFGDDLKMSEGQINRSKLGRIVFSDPSRLARLEEIVHPRVSEAILKQIDNCERRVLVIEAIKLIESGITAFCDQVWTVAADENLRFQRLIESRGHTDEIAWKKIKAQPPQEEKFPFSDSIIWTNNSFQDSYQQTMQALHDLELPLSHTIVKDNFTITSLREKDFDWLISVAGEQASEYWNHERIYQLLGVKNVPTIWLNEKPLQCQRLSTRQTLGLLTNQYPISSEQVSNNESIDLLESWLKGAYRLLIVPHNIKTPKEAWEEGFLPGQDGADHCSRESYEIFLKENGLMPGEVWIKLVK